LQPNGESVPVGYDGDAYVVDLAPLNRLRVEQPQGARCTVSFAYRPVAGQIPTIGPLRCR
jgi:outer membrane usher protein